MVRFPLKILEILTHQNRCLHAPSSSSLQLRASRSWRRDHSRARCPPPPRCLAPIRCLPSIIHGWESRKIIHGPAAFPALYNEPEHTMAPATALIPIRAGRAPIAFASPEDLFDALQTCHDLLPERCEHDVSADPAL